jgi:hypothetical protein
VAPLKEALSLRKVMVTLYCAAWSVNTHCRSAGAR